MKKVLLAGPNDWWGEVQPPEAIDKWGDTGPGGLIMFLNVILRLVFVGAGLFAFFNLIIAGFQFISAGGNPKAIGDAVGRIWKSLLGLVIIVSSFAIAGIIGWIIFGDPSAILQPSITGPGG